jgi:hypothetical protein
MRGASVWYITPAALRMTLTPGRLGEALRLWFLEKRLAVPYRRIAGLCVADRVSGATAYPILFAVGLAAYQSDSPTYRDGSVHPFDRSGVPLDAALSAMIMTRLMFLWLPVGVGTLLLPMVIKMVRTAGRVS